MLVDLEQGLKLPSLYFNDNAIKSIMQSQIQHSVLQKDAFNLRESKRHRFSALSEMSKNPILLILHHVCFIFME